MEHEGVRDIQVHYVQEEEDGNEKVDEDIYEEEEEEENENIHVKRRGHASALRKSLDYYRVKEKFTDVTIACGSRIYRAHKVILASCSEYFARIISNVQAEHPILVLVDVKEEVVGQILDYVYRGELLLPRKHLQEFLSTARQLCIRGLSVAGNYSVSECNEEGNQEKEMLNEAGVFSVKNGNELILNEAERFSSVKTGHKLILNEAGRCSSVKTGRKRPKREADNGKSFKEQKTGPLKGRLSSTSGKTKHRVTIPINTNEDTRKRWTDTPSGPKETKKIKKEPIAPSDVQTEGSQEDGSHSLESTPDNMGESSQKDATQGNITQPDSKITYRIMKGLSARGKDKLYDSLGYVYNVQGIKGGYKCWQCTSRTKKLYCNASVRQSGDLFITGRPHSHEPKDRANVKAMLFKAAKEAALEAPAASAAVIVENIVREHFPGDKPEDVYGSKHLVRRLNYHRQMHRAMN